ncbi:MAG: flagellar filament capping protein FliD, partial [Burkholderiales bacterium]|nr:flagellar filament capping protein FliD [Burkholderiales bacterium]
TASATRGAVTAGSAIQPSTVIDGENDGFQIRVNGIASGTVRIAHGNYNAESLAVALQAALGTSATLTAAGLVPLVSVSDGKMVISSPAYGSASTIGGAAGNASGVLGYSGSESGAGRDVAGHFEAAGVISAATGSGQELTAARGTPADGLTVSYSGTDAQLQSGVTGTLRLTEGYAMRLDRLASRLLNDTGPISSRTGGIDRSIEDITRQRDSINRRLVATEARIRAQFTALDTLISRLSNTSNFLTQQLANLPGSSNSRN